MEHGIATSEELTAFVAQYDAQALPYDPQVSAEEQEYYQAPITVPLPAFLIMCVVAIVLVATVLLVG